MNGLLERISSGEGLLTRFADRVAGRFLPEVTAAGSCYYRCTGRGCYDFNSSFGGHYSCEYCSAGYWTGNCYCTKNC